MMTRRDLLATAAASVIPGGFLCRCGAADDADPTRVFTGDKKPTDVRLGPPKTLNDYFPFAVPKTKEAWEARRNQLREQLLVANGLWPLPEKTPLNPVIHGKTERDGYTIEKVFFASMPGHYVSGSLYRPLVEQDKLAKLPAVLCPHGHWANGRFYEATDASVAADLKRGAETTKEGARYPLQARCANLAMMGFVVFHYDMVGNADSKAIPHREGFKDVEAELRAQNFMGLQTWNSIRALDFVESLPGVDPKRIGVTGASGGGTQTFMLCAVDDRLAAAFPAVMVSTAMQGGCVCENCSGLRVNTGNVEIAALFAPKPMALSCADDWTKEFMTKGFPDLQALYGLYGAKDKVAAKAWLDFPHNYSQPSREFMYSWFANHLLGRNSEIPEKPFVPVPPKELSVYDADHPRPKDELDAPKLREVMTKASDAQMKALEPKDAKSLAEFKRVVGTALRRMVNSEPLPSESIGLRGTPENLLTNWPEGMKGFKCLYYRNVNRDVVHPALIPPQYPPDRDRIDLGIHIPVFGAWSPKAPGNRDQFDRTIIWVHPRGKASLFENGKWVPVAKKLLDSGYRVVAPDVLLTGEQVGEKSFPVDKNYAGYTYGYNRTLLANRVRDVLAVIMGEDRRKAVDGFKLHLVGFGEMGPVAILAKALAGDAVAKTAADLNQFRFETIKDTADPMLLPGAVKYGGLGAFLALCAPGEVLVHNHAGTASGKLSQAAYEAAGARDKLTRVNEKLDDLKVVEWLVK